MKFNRRLLILSNLFPNKDNSFYGGIFVKEQVNELKKYFKEITVISPQPLGTKRNLKDYNYDNVKVYYPRFFHLPITFFRKHLGNNYFKVASQIIEKENIDFDLIHAHFAWPSGYAGVKLKEKYKKPLIVTAHGNDIRIPLTNYIQSFDNKYLKMMLDVIIKKADAILTHHEELRDLLLSNYPNLKYKIYFTYKGINLERFNPFSEKILENAKKYREKLALYDKFIVLFLARVDWDKDPETLVKAAKILRNEKNVMFLIVGSGKLESKIRKLKAKNNLKNLIIIGKRSDTEVWYALSDVFCALSPVENIWSTTLQEALCMGKPSIVTKVGYTEKILTHLHDAYLIPPKNPQILVNAILELKSDEELRKKLSQNALKWREKFDYSKISGEIIAIYEKVLQDYQK